MNLLEILDREKLSLLITKNEQRLFEAKEGGVAPLIYAIDTLGLETMKDSTVTDKVVGKAAALLIIYSGVREVNAKLISMRAITTFEKHAIPCRYQEIVDEILNRDKTAICIFEQTVGESENPAEAFKRLKLKTESLKKNKSNGQA